MISPRDSILETVGLPLPVDNPLGARNCPECGYSREGLPAEERCPECGSEFWGDEIVLYGWGTGGSATVANANPGRLSALLVWSTMMFGFWIFLAKNISASFYIIALLSLGVSLYALGRRWRASAQTSAPLQLRISAKGYSVRLGLGPANWRLWLLSDEVAFEQRPDGRHRVRIERSRDMLCPDVVRTVDMEVELDSGTAAEITQRVREFQFGPNAVLRASRFE